MDDNEAFLLILLSDSNLPTGSFVASSGLESYVKHGFPSSDSSIVHFIRDSLNTYGQNAMPFVSDSHEIIRGYLLQLNTGETSNDGLGEEQNVGNAVMNLSALDDLYHAMSLNHVAKRASMSQGVALLTLYTKGFSWSPSGSLLDLSLSPEIRLRERRSALLFERFKLKVRREEAYGHLPICWGALTAALGMTLERSQYLHLFLHARSVLSASIRLNIIGPYGAQQLLLHEIRPLVQCETQHFRHLRTGLFADANSGFDITKDGPANTWPLGEILAARHDLQHSRIFNS